jgi:hypothetical protein
MYSSSMPCTSNLLIFILCKSKVYSTKSKNILAYPKPWSLIIYLLAPIQNTSIFSTICMRYLQEEKFLVTSTNRYAQNVIITTHHCIERVKVMPHLCPCNQPTKLRISYVHEVNNSRTQLLSMSHTTIPFLVHQVFQ